jgi:hypothetical protein
MKERNNIHIVREDDPGAGRPLYEADDPAVIRADIERTRQRMSHTVEELGERLHPDRLKGQMKQNLHDATIGKAEHMARVAVDRVDDTRHSIMDNVRENPIPAALVGIGLGWLYLNSRRDHHDSSSRDFRYDREYAAYRRGYSPYERGFTTEFGRSGVADGEPGRPDYGEDRGALDRAEDMGERVRERAGEAASHARERAGELAHRAQERVTEIANDVRDTAHEITDRTQEVIGTGASRARSVASDLAWQTRRGGHRVEDRLEHALRDSPLAVGAAAVAIGLAVGLSAPATRRESEMMGEKRDEMLDRAKDKTRAVSHRARDVASHMAHELESTAREVAEEEGLA